MVSKALKDEINHLHAHVCSGLADPIRILILYKLNEGAHKVTGLAETLDTPQSTISRHLKVLRERGMVTSQREGASVFYSLSDQRVIEALDILRSIMADNLKSQAQLAQTATESYSNPE